MAHVCLILLVNGTKRKCEPIRLYLTDRPSTAVHIDKEKQPTPLVLFICYKHIQYTKGNAFSYSNMQ